MWEMPTSRLLLRGAHVFDGSGADPSPADIAIENGRIADIGPNLDGDQAVDLGGKTVLPGLFDCHTHVAFTTIDLMSRMQTPFSLRFYEAIGNLAATLRLGITSIRDAGGADLGIKEAVQRKMIRGPRMQVSIRMLEPDRRPRR